ncbi:hypothetical protein PIB30_110084, partial [Stylosanthes scabra]|nr:hypothetical protein [Stylosanthes scabra]
FYSRFHMCLSLCFSFPDRRSSISSIAPYCCVASPPCVAATISTSLSSLSALLSLSIFLSISCCHRRCSRRHGS